MGMQNNKSTFLRIHFINFKIVILYLQLQLTSKVGEKASFPSSRFRAMMNTGKFFLLCLSKQASHASKFRIFISFN